MELPNGGEREGAVQVLGITLSVATAACSMPEVCERNVRLTESSMMVDPTNSLLYKLPFPSSAKEQTYDA